MEILNHAPVPSPKAHLKLTKRGKARVCLHVQHVQYYLSVEEAYKLANQLVDAAEGVERREVR